MIQLAWAQYIGKQHGIIVVTIYSDTVNRMRRRRDKLIMGCKREENYKRKNTSESKSSLESIYNMKFKYPFRLIYVLSGNSWKVMVRYELHNRQLSKNIDDHNILGCLNDHERQFMNDMIK